MVFCNQGEVGARLLAALGGKTPGLLKWAAGRKSGCGTLGGRSRVRQIDTIIHRVAQSLFAAEISLGRLD